MTNPREATLVRWGAWVHLWWTAAKRQATRITDADFDEMQPDIVLFVQALANLARGAIRILGDDHDAVRSFKTSQPGLKDLRDMLEHFDEYAEGRGRRTLPSGTPFNTFFARNIGENGHAAIYMADTHIDVGLAMQAGDALALEALAVATNPAPRATGSM